MMSKRLLALDMDGTLLASNSTLSEQNAQAIRRAVKAGIHVALATGRTYRAAFPYAQALGLDLPIIAYNGALLRSTAGEVLYEKKIPCTVARGLVQAAEARGLYVKAYVNDLLLTKELDDRTVEFSRLHGVEARAVGLLSEYLTEEVNMVVVASDAAAIRRYKQDVLPLYQAVHGMSSGDKSVDIVSAEASKAKGVRHLARMLGVLYSDVVAVGNAENDIDMICWAGLGVAVANATRELQSKADLILPYTNDQHGVAELIYSYLLV